MGGLPPLARSDFQSWVDGARTDLFALRGPDGMVAAVCNHAARLVSLQVPDGQGGLAETLLGYDNLAGYLRGQPSMGAFIGRWAGRLRHGRLRLPDGAVQQLPCNGGAHAVHGGPRGSRFRTFQVDAVQPDALQLSHTFRPEDDGVPGVLHLQLVYQLLPDATLRIHWRAQAAEAPTLAQFTAHPFFNLSGTPRSALDHLLHIPAGRYLPLAPDGCPEGMAAAVTGTPLDFRMPRTPRQAAALPHAQLQMAKGLDHYWLLDVAAALPGQAHQAAHQATHLPPHLAAHLHSPHSGICMDVLTSEPGLQFYAGHGLTGALPRDLGRGGWRWAPGDGLCLEPMGWPDAPNQAHAPAAWLAPGHTRCGEIVYRFGRG